MEDKYTHTGIIIGNACVGNKQLLCKLKKTKTLWITSHGRRFSKKSGMRSPVEKWPIWHLDLDSIKKIKKGNNQ